MTEGLDNEFYRSLELFVEAVDRTSNLEIICEEVKNGKDILVVENANQKTDSQWEIETSEIFAVIRDCKTAQQFIDVINQDRKAVVLDGITRIVGYYSRTKNWNKSKIGELRDRQGEYYTLSGKAPIHEEARNKTVNSLS